MRALYFPSPMAENQKEKPGAVSQPGGTVQVTVNIGKSPDEYRFSYAMAPADPPEAPIDHPAHRVVDPGSSTIAPGLRAAVADWPGRFAK